MLLWTRFTILFSDFPSAIGDGSSPSFPDLKFVTDSANCSLSAHFSNSCFALNPIPVGNIDLMAFISASKDSFSSSTIKESVGLIGSAW